ncbi:MULTISPECIES: HAMP domain-containing sensor histidine kinase [Vagococcus]|uniref:sensor histidine kinase n=1 Tax=Vagococcus TaxID=2737 RepID=UPI000B3531B0|nr:MULTISPECIES: HAMP domain-containing sensor histidine kinase [Vagococcus]HCM89839.1 sensor histidine kinase [Vagococcus sp.]
MISKRITSRLIRNYTVLLILFSTVILGFFFSLLNRQVATVHQEQIKEQGNIIAKNIMNEGLVAKEESNESNRHGKMRMQENHMATNNSYLQLISKLSTDDIFIVDEKGQSLIGGHMMDEEPQELSQSGQEILKEIVRNNQAVFFETGQLSNSGQMGYGVPLISKNGDNYGYVIVLSTKTITLTQSIKDYRLLIWSILLALLVVVFISVWLARSFVKPIHEMADFTEELIQMNYQDELEINTKDELAELGNKLLILSNRLEVARNDQDNKEQSQKLFLSQISHELRTPVMVIKNSLEALKGNFLNETERKNYIEQLLKETEQLNLLVNDLLELSRLQSTEFSIKIEELHLNDVLTDSARSFRQRADDEGNKIKINSQLKSSDIYRGDYQRLLQLMKILLDNALKYSPVDEMVFCSLNRTNEGFELEISNKSKERITEFESDAFFEAFNRGKIKKENGHGLGLTIAKQIVTRHQGSIQFNVVNSNNVQIKVNLPQITS